LFCGNINYINFYLLSFATLLMNVDVYQQF